MIKRDGELPVRMATIVMEFAAFTAVADVVVLLIGRTVFPRGAAILALTVPLLVGGLSRLRFLEPVRRGRWMPGGQWMWGGRVRRVLPLLVQGLGLVGAVWFALGAVDGVSVGAAPFSAGLVAGLALLLWFRGWRIYHRAASFSQTVIRFDVGLGLLVAVGFIRMGVGSAVGFVPEAPFVPGVVLYVLSGGGALVLARAQTDARPDETIRSLASFLLPGVAAVVVAAAAVYATLPFLVRAADGVYTLLSDGLTALEPWIAWLVRGLFGRGFAVSSGGAPSVSPAISAGEAGQYGESGWFAVLMGRVLAWGFVGLLGAVVVGVVGVQVIRFLKGLWNRPDDEDEDVGLRDLRQILMGMVRMVGRFFMGFLRGTLHGIGTAAGALVGFVKGRGRSVVPNPGTAAFRRLLRWGRYGGMRRRSWETPAGYARRLAGSFPEREQDFRVVVEAVQREYYGGQTLERDTRDALSGAVRRLGSPWRLIVLHPVRGLRQRLTWGPL
ncbi:MAG: DUF4129 domain-containing protein [Alkalispirochaeta sp.]